MKQLYIVRHAKSSWDYPDLPDYERPLTEKGKKRTRKIIEFLQQQGAKPDFILCSSALRTRETAAYLAKGLGVDKQLINADSALYHADVNLLFEQFNDLSDRFTSVMLVGHNPTLTNFVNYFLVPPIDWLPTSGVVALQFDTDSWDQLAKAHYQVLFVVFPKLLDS